jgi:hypothetical protein
MTKTSATILSALIPGISTDHADAIQALAATGLSMPQMMQAVMAQTHINAFNAELAKVHPLSTFTMAAADWASMWAYLTDQAPITDSGQSLLQLVWTAGLNGNQATFWPALAQLFKTWGIVRGLVQPVPGGGVILSGVAPTGITPPATLAGFTSPSTS